MGTRHKHADVIHAWAEGEEIEIFYNGQWIDAKTPNFCTMYEYRIKPKIVKREGWVNVYKGGIITNAFKTKDEAIVDGSEDSDLVDCIRIEWEEEV